MLGVNVEERTCVEVKQREAFEGRLKGREEKGREEKGREGKGRGKEC